MTAKRNYVLVPFVSSPAIPPPRNLADRLGRIVAWLRRDLAAHAVKDRALQAIVVVLWNRLNRILERFTATATRHRAGTRHPPPAKPPRRPTTAHPPPPPRDPLPRQRGWLVRRLTACAVYGSQLGALLEDPRMVELLAASPQARRTLRPLWRMLRLDPVPELLRPPRRPAVPPVARRPDQPRRPRLHPAAPPGAAPAGAAAIPPSGVRRFNPV